MQNLGIVPTGTTFTVTVQMATTVSTNPMTPTVSIITYYTTGKIVDQYLNAPFSIASIANTNLPTLNTFTIPNPQSV